MQEGEEKETKVNKKTTVFMFSSDREDGGERIDKYIKKAFDWYTEEVGKDVDLARYMYMPVQKEGFTSSDESNSEEKVSASDEPVASTN